MGPGVIRVTGATISSSGQILASQPVAACGLIAKTTGRNNMLRRSLLGAVAALAMSAAAAFAADDKPAIVFDIGGKFDKSFNEEDFQRRREVQEPRPALPMASSRSPTKRSASRRSATFADQGYSARSLPRASHRPPRVEKGRQGIPRPQICDHRHGRRPAECSVAWSSRKNEGSYLVGMLAAHGFESPAKSALSAAWISR